MLEKQTNKSEFAAIPEQEQAQLFAFVVAEILAALPQALEAQANFDARCMALAFAAEIVASSAKDASFNVSSAIASAVVAVASKVNQAVETKNASKSSAAPAKAADKIEGIRTLRHGQSFEAELSQHEIDQLRVQAGELFAQQQLASGMQLVELDGVVYVQLPMVGEDGATTTLLVPLENMQQHSGGFTLSVQTLGVSAFAGTGQARSLAPEFRQRDLVLSPEFMATFFDEATSAEEMLRRLNAERALLEQLVRAYDEQQRQCGRPLWPQTMAEIYVPFMPANDFKPSNDDLPLAVTAFSRAI